VPDEFAGKKLKCKNCNAIFRASAPPPPPPKRRSEDDDEADEKGRPKRRDEDEEEPEEKPRSRRRAEDEDADEKPRSRRREEVDDEPEEKPRSRRREEDDDEPEEKPRSRRRDDDDKKPKSRRRDEDDESDERPRRKKSAGRDRGKSKKKVTPAYIIGVILASLFLIGALSFVGWRAGLFQGKTEEKDRTNDDEEQPKYVAPDPRIGAGRKETTGLDGERVSAVERLRLTIDVSSSGADHKVVVTFQVVSGPSIGANDRLVVREADRAYVVQAVPVIDKSDSTRGTFTFTLSDESRRKAKKLWVAVVLAKSQDALKDGVRVSNAIAMP
jgi:hypothetical protein